MSRTYNNIYDTNANDKVVNQNGEDKSFVYGDLNQRVQVVNAKSINSSTAYVSVNEDNAIMVDVKRVPSKLTVFDESTGQTVQFDGSSAIQISLPEIITEIAYRVSPAKDVPAEGFVEGEHYLDFTYGIGTFARHKYVSLKPMQNLIASEAQTRYSEDSRIEGRLDDEINRAKGKEADILRELRQEESDRYNEDTRLQGSIDAINAKIPNQASSENQLADKAFVNSSIQNMAAFYVTSDAQGNPFSTKADLVASTTVYIDGVEAVPGVHDYCIVLEDESKHTVSGDPTTRYIYSGRNTEPYDATKWDFQYVINNTGLTAEQLAAINSGITSSLVGKFNAYETNKQDLLIDDISVELDPTLEGQQNIKTINGQTIRGAGGNIQIDGVTNYNDLNNKPIINADLSEITPVENTYYKHTGEDTQGKSGINVGDEVDTLYFDTDIDVESMNLMLADFKDSGYLPAFSDTHESLWIAARFGTLLDETEILIFWVDGEVSPTGRDFYYIVRTHNLDLDDLTAEDFIYVSDPIQGDSVSFEVAGWQTPSLDIDGETTEYNFKSFLDQFIYVYGGTSLEHNLIYLYRNGEYVVSDYNLEAHTPIINADAVNGSVKNGEYYKQTSTAFEVTPLENNKYYARFKMTKDPEGFKINLRFIDLIQNVNPDYVVVRKNNSSYVVNYPYLDEYIADGYSVDNYPKYWVLIGITDNLPKTLNSATYYPPLMAVALSAASCAILYQVFFPIWTNYADTTSSGTIVPFTWPGEQGNVLQNYQGDYLPINMQGTASLKIHKYHTDFWDDLFVNDFVKIDKGTIGKKVDDSFKPLLYEETKELPDIDGTGKVLMSTGDATFDTYFTYDEELEIYKHSGTKHNRLLYLFANVNLPYEDLMATLNRLFVTINSNEWHILVQFGSGWSSSDITDIYFIRDNSERDSEGNPAYLIAKKIRNANEIVPVYSNYVKTYTVDGESVVVSAVGWQPFGTGNQQELYTDAIFGQECDYIYYSSPSMVVPAEIYGKIITTTVENVDTSHLPSSADSVVLFYGDVENARPIWADIEIPSVDILPDYSNTPEGEVLKVKVTPEEQAFTPKIKVGDDISDGLYMLKDKFPESFNDYETNLNIWGSKLTKILRFKVLYEDNGSPTTEFISLILSQISGAKMFAIGKQTSDEGEMAIVGYIYQFINGAETWEDSVLDDSDPPYTKIDIDTILDNLGYSNYTTEVDFISQQDKWGSWLGSSMNVSVIKEEEHTLEWGSPLPEITKPGQVLMSDCETYSFEFTQFASNDYRCLVSSDGRLYFNTQTSKEEMINFINVFAVYTYHGFAPYHFGVYDDTDTLVADFTFALNKDQETNSEYTQNVIFVDYPALQLETPYMLYSSYTGDFKLDFASNPISVEEGWYLDNLENHTSWANGSYMKIIDDIDVSYYGFEMSLQEGLFYGQVKDAKAKWVDLEIPEPEIIPDYREASDGEVLKVKVTPESVMIVPNIEVGDTVSSLYVRYEGMPTNFSDFETNDASMGAQVSRLIRLEVTGTLEGTSGVTKYLSICAMQYNDVAPYLFVGIQDTLSDDIDLATLLYVVFPPYMYGWETRAIVETGDFYEVLSKALDDIGYTGYTLTVESLFEQAKWVSWLGCSTDAEVIAPETKEMEWGSPYPEIKKSGQVLKSSCETYSLEFVRNASYDYRCQVESSGKLYFNTDLEESNIISAINTLAQAASSSHPQFILQAKNSSDQMLTPRFCFVVGDNSTYAIFALVQTDAYQLWANFEGELVVDGTQTGITCSIGWNSSNLENNTSWTGASYIQYTAPNTTIPVSIYGRLMSLQDGLFYGDIRNTKAVWEDLDISSDLSGINVDYNNIQDYNSSSSSDAPYRLFGQHYSNDTNVASFGKDSIKQWLGVKDNVSNTFTVNSNSWSSSNDEYYTQVYISGLTNDDTLIVTPGSQSDAKNAQEINIYYAYSSGEYLYMYCTEQPSTTITFSYTIIR